MMSAASAAEPAKTAPRAAAALPAGQWQKRGNDLRGRRARTSEHGGSAAVDSFFHVTLAFE
jgi:hypothetical protein